MSGSKETLKQTDIFSNLSEQELAEIEKIGKVKEFRRGSIIFNQGEEAQGAFVIISGSVKIYKIGHDGRTYILHIFGPNEIFAEAVMFSGKSYPAFAQTLKDTKIFYLPKNHFLQLVEKKPKVAMKMLGAQAARLRQFAAKIEDLSLKEVSARLAGYLLEQIDVSKSPGEKGHSVKLSMNKSQLAAYLGTISETLSRTFHNFKEQKVIEEEDHLLFVKDLAKLQDLARS